MQHASTRRVADARQAPHMCLLGPTLRHWHAANVEKTQLDRLWCWPAAIVCCHGMLNTPEQGLLTAGACHSTLLVIHAF
jgi:hypothetical protein